MPLPGLGESVGLFRRERAVLQVTGSERRRFLDGLLTNDMKTLRPGGCLYAALLDDRGRVLGDLDVYDAGEGYLLDTSSAQGEPLRSRLSRARVSEDVAVTDRTRDFARFTVAGVRAPALISEVVGREAPARGAWMEHADGLVARLDPLGIPGFEILAEAPGEGWVGRLRAAGAEPRDRAAWDVLRIDAGRAEYGTDMDERTMALEAPIRDAISFTKGCYVGQEVVSRVENRGRTRRRLVRLVVDSSRAPDRGSAVSDGDVAVGRVTSAASADGRTVALAYVETDRLVSGTPLWVESASGPVAVTVREGTSP